MLLMRYAVEHWVSRFLERAGATSVGFGGWLLRLVGLGLTVVTIVEIWVQFTSHFGVFGPIPRLPWGG